jgi:hypothetical protein
MPQPYEISDNRRVFFNGVEPPGYVTMNESGMTEDGLTVVTGSETGPRQRNIASGLQQIPVLEFVYYVKRDRKAFEFFKDLHENNTLVECVVYHVDSTGKIDNAVHVSRYADCEVSPPNFIANDSENPEVAKFNVRLFPYDYDEDRPE